MTPLLVALALVVLGQTGAAAAPETIAAVRVHGNHVTTDDEILKLAGLAIGQPFGPSTLADVSSRLRETDRFADVEVLKRFASIEDPTQVLIVIVVNEGPVRLEVPDNPDLPIRVVKRRGLTNVMYMPLLDAEDGYGLTYGVRVAYVRVAGRRGRVSFPLTWGGHKQAGVEFDRPLAAGPLSRVQVGAAIDRVRNPAFSLDDTRRRVWARVERTAGPVRAGGTIGWEWVSFDATEQHVRTAGADVTLDTRRDPLLPRNAVLASAAWTRLDFRSGRDVHRLRLDGHGFVGLKGQSVLVLRALREDASQPVPPPFQSLLGGWSNLRGFKAGSGFGDTLVAGSVEVRVPLSSPLRVGRVGVSGFVDTGTVYPKPSRLRDQALLTGIGGGVWLTATTFHMGLAVAHGRGARTRVNFSAGLSF